MEPALQIQEIQDRPSHAGTELRRLKTAAEYAQAVELQQLTWGPSFREIVPAAILKISQRVGGVCAGAFGSDGVLQAFVYGLSGVEGGRLIHWSHMLAVRPELRDCGLGRQLKVFQRTLLQKTGIELMYWTFDPLVARNAHFNLNILGVQVRDYLEDMYEGSGSPLHASGTDRLLAAWPVNGITVVEPGTHVTYDDAPIVCGEPVDALAVRIEVPGDISDLSMSDAQGIRMRTRAAFTACLDQGYAVRGFYRSMDRRCFYVLTNGTAMGR